MHTVFDTKREGFNKLIQRLKYSQYSWRLQFSNITNPKLRQLRVVKIKYFDFTIHFAVFSPASVYSVLPRLSMRLSYKATRFGTEDC